MEDNVVIAKEELSRKELFLKDRLYTKRNTYDVQTTTEKMDLSKNFGKEAIPVHNDRPVMKFPVPDPVNTSTRLYNAIQ